MVPLRPELTNCPCPSALNLGDVHVKIKHLTLAAIGIAMAAFATPASAQWTGCGVGVGGSVVDGQAYNTIGISLQGEKGDIQVFCNKQMGQFVVGAAVSYGLFWGDVKDVGKIKDEWGGLLRAGILTDRAQDNLFYLHVGGTHIDASGGKANGFKLGLGDEWKLGNAGAPVTVDLRGSYTQFNPDDFGVPTSVKVNSYEVRLGVNVAFYRDAPAAAHPLK